jgi:hypothetical protein
MSFEPFGSFGVCPRCHDKSKKVYQESRSAKPMAGLCHVEACRYADVDQYAILASSIVVFWPPI